MPKLRKYEIDAITSEIRDRLKKEVEEKKQSEEFQKRIRIEVDKFVTEEGLSEYEYLCGKIKELKSKIQEFEEQIAPLNKKLQAIRSGHFIGHFSSDVEKFKNIVEKHVIKQIIKIPVYSEVERAVILTDISGSDDVIADVMKKLKID